MSLSTECRNAAYRTLEHLPVSRARVYRIIIEFGPISAGDIGAILGWTPNRVTGRLMELRQAGLVEEAGTEVGAYGKRVTCWRVAVPKTGPQLELALATGPT